MSELNKDAKKVVSSAFGLEVGPQRSAV